MPEVRQKDNEIEKLNKDRTNLKRKAEDAETAKKNGDLIKLSFFC